MLDLIGGISDHWFRFEVRETNIRSDVSKSVRNALL